VGDSIDMVTIEVNNRGSIYGRKLEDMNGNGGPRARGLFTKTSAKWLDIELYDQDWNLLDSM
jgi:hypothetical protein